MHQLSQFKMIFGKERGAEIFSFFSPASPPSHPVRVLYSLTVRTPPCSLEIWKQLATAPTVPCFYIMQRLAKVQWTNLDSAPKDAVNFFYYRLTFFNRKRRSAMNALRHWNFRRDIWPVLARVLRCLLRLCFPNVKGGASCLAQPAVILTAHEFFIRHFNCVQNWQSMNKEALKICKRLSHDGEWAKFNKNSAPLPLLKTFERPLSAWYISLDSTFKHSIDTFNKSMNFTHEENWTKK